MRKSPAVFWREAAQSLPAPVQARYRGYFEAAERWELLLDRAIELGARAKQRLARSLQAHPA